MKQKRVIGPTLALLAAMGGGFAGAAWGQADATASRSLEISLFGGPAGVWTGLDGGHNISVTAGLDVGLRSFYGLKPALEVRGLYPINSGSVDAQKNVMGGLRLEKLYSRTRVWGDFLFGRGQIDYQNGGFLNTDGTYKFLTSTSNVLSPGVGLSRDLTSQFSVFGDVQFQKYDSPATSSGTLWSKPVTLGVTYRLPFARHGRPY